MVDARLDHRAQSIEIADMHSALVNPEHPLFLKAGKLATYGLDCNTEVIGNVMARHAEIKISL